VERREFKSHKVAGIMQSVQSLWDAEIAPHVSRKAGINLDVRPPLQRLSCTVCRDAFGHYGSKRPR